jgi:hypothetical protein
MNAPADIRPKPAWHRHLPTVDALRPGEANPMRRARSRIMGLRDLATKARMDGAEWHADQVLATVEQLGVAYALATVPIDELEALLDTMAALMTQAASLQVRCPGRAQ